MNQQITLATLAELDELVGLLNVLFTQDIEFEPNHEKQRAGLAGETEPEPANDGTTLSAEDSDQP